MRSYVMKTSSLKIVMFEIIDFCWLGMQILRWNFKKVSQEKVFKLNPLYSVIYFKISAILYVHINTCVQNVKQTSYTQLTLLHRV